MNRVIDNIPVNLTINGKRITSQIYIQGSPIIINDAGEYRDPDSFKLFVVEENDKKGLYQLSPEGLKELLPCSFERIDAEMICGKVFILGEKLRKEKHQSLLVSDYYFFDRFQNKLSECLVENVYKVNKLEGWSNVILFIHDNGNFSLWSLGHMREYPICIEKNFSDINEISKLDDCNRKVYLIEGIKENGKTKDKLISLVSNRISYMHETNIKSDEIHFICEKKHNLDRGCLFMLKDCNKINFLWHPYYCSDKPILKRPKFNAIEGFIVQELIKKDRNYDALYDFGLEDELNSQLCNFPIVFLVVENEKNKKAIASVNFKGEELDYNLLTPYIFDNITYLRTTCDFKTEFDGEDFKDFHVSPIYSEFSVSYGGRTKTLHYDAEKRKFITKKPQIKTNSSTLFDKMIDGIRSSENECELPF